MTSVSLYAKQCITGDVLLKSQAFTLTKDLIQKRPDLQKQKIKYETLKYQEPIKDSEVKKLSKLLDVNGKLKPEHQKLLEQNYEEDSIFLESKLDPIKLAAMNINYVHEFVTPTGLTKLCLFISNDTIYIVFKANDCSQGNALKQELNLSDEEQTAILRDFNRLADITKLAKAGKLDNLNEELILDIILDNSHEAQALKKNY